MAIIPNPVSGQPIDYAYINAIVNQTNTLTTSFSSTNTKAVLGGSEQSKIPLIVANTTILSSTKLDAGKETEVTILFGSIAKFADKPWVTLSYEPDASTSKLLTLTITEANTTQAKVSVNNTSSSAKTFSGKIHAIVVGVPSGSAG